MIRITTWLMVLLAAVYLWIGQSPVDGKCVGKWALHSCLSGNGKRSDPAELSGSSSEQSGGLERLILDAAANSRPSLARQGDESVESYLDQEERTGYGGSPGESSEAKSLQSILAEERLRALWRKLLLALRTKHSA